LPSLIFYHIKLDFPEVTLNQGPIRIPGRKLGDTRVYLPRHRLHRLRRVLGVPALFSSAYGNVGSSITYALGVTAAFALGLTPIVFILAGILFAFTTLSYVEGTAAIPKAGGSSSFARRGFNEMVSFIAGWALMLDYIITMAISAFSVSNYLAIFAPVLKTWPTNSIGGVLVIAFLMGINIMGIKQATAVNVVLAILSLATQVVIVIVGFIFLFDYQVLINNVHLGEAPRWDQLIYGISIAMIAYTGIETISNMAEESKNPGKDVPRSAGLVVLTVLIIYAGFSLVALSALPVSNIGGKWTTELATTWLTDPVMGVAHSLPVVSSLIAVWVGLLSAIILLIATNAGIIGISRLTYSMGQHKQVLPILSQIHPKSQVPWIAIVVFCVMAMVLILPGKIELLAELYSFGAMLAFTVAHFSIIALRLKAPDMERPYKAPLNIKIKGKPVPLTAVIGGLGTFSVWLVVIYSHELGRNIGLIWVTVGLVLYILYRRHLKVSVFETIEVTQKRQP